jgi:peptidoglycan glycosyltransferase
LQNFGGEHCLGGAPTITLSEAFTVSCNVVFGEVGLKVGAKALSDQAYAFGFGPGGKQVPFEVPFAEGQFPEPSYFDQRQPNLAFAAIGQDEVKANPLQMALVASAIANGGTMMEPRLVAEIKDPQGHVISQTTPTPYGNPISAQTASELTTMMVNVVNQGTGTAAQIPGIQVAGKTGTAQNAVGQAPHAWFSAFAPADNPQIAVSVVVLNGGSLGSEATGGAVAAPIAKKIIEAALQGGTH